MPADEDDMQHGNDTDGDGQQHHGPEQHLPRVQDVEESADADRVDAILGFTADPLGVEVGLRQVAGEGSTDGGDEGDDTGDPRQRAPAAPGSHPELAPEMDDHHGHEDLDAPEVEGVDEAAEVGRVPPGHATHRED